MRRSTALESQWKAETKSGSDLQFLDCKGGYFSVIDDYGLMVMGATAQDGAPTPDSPVPISCVRAGSKVMCGNEVTAPCDLYEGDVWYPMTGKVVKKRGYVQNLTSVAKVGRKTNAHIRFEAFQGSKIGSTAICNRFPYVASANGIYVGNNTHVDFFISYDMIGCTTENTNAELVSAMNQWLSENPTEIVYEMATPVVEQYTPQPIFMPGGVANVLQEPVDLLANLEATVLVRR